jgi:hypothetical protein
MTTFRSLSIPCVGFLLLMPTPWAVAQTADTPIYQQHGPAIKSQHQAIIDNALRLRGELNVIDKTEIDRQLLAPVPQPVQLLSPLISVMNSEEIAQHARRTNLRVGYCYKCMNCDDWHINLAGGYAIAADVIVTCDHVLLNKTKMRDGFLVVADHEGNIAIGSAILARSAAMDAAIVKVAGAKFSPVPLNAEIKQGSPAYCFSYPLQQQGYFSTGVVNRFFWNEHYSGQARDSIDALLHLRVNYTTDWAPGSSGSPLFDSAGNVTGHVSTISGLGGGKNKGTMMTLRTGIPARSVQGLAGSMRNSTEIQRIANLLHVKPQPQPNPSGVEPTPSED